MDLEHFLRFALPASIALVVVSLGLRASVSDAAYLFRRPRLLLRSIVAMYVVMPVIAAALAIGLGLHPAVRVALVALAISPVPPFLPVRQLTMLGTEQRCYVHGLLVATSVLAVVVVPGVVTLLGAMLGRDLRANPFEIARIAATTVLAPLAAGLALRRRWPAAERLGLLTARLNNVLLLVAAVLLLAYAWPAMISLIGDGTLLAIVGMTLIGLVVGHVLGGPHDDYRSVLALSTATRHPGVAVAVAGIADQPLAPAAILLYVLVSAVISSPYVAWRKRLKTSTSAPARN